MKTKGPCAGVMVLLAGLVFAQLIATIQVHWSNNVLYHSLEAMRDAGYLLVPNEIVMAGLRGVFPAFYGGIFFTLTLGAGLTLAGFGFAWIWDRFFRRNRIMLLPIILLWCLGVGAVNWNGCSLFGTLYFGMIPPIVFLTVLWIIPRNTETRFSLVEMIPFLPLLVLAVLWVPRMGAGAFTDIRDNLLLSTSVGIAITESYYQYTLYPAYALKSLDQRLLKTCRLTGFDSPSIKQSLERKLLKYDYLPLSSGAHSSDLTLSRNEKDVLTFSHTGRIVLEQSLGTFLASPGDVLKEYSRRLDRHRFLRATTFWSLLFASPLVLYILIFSVVRALFTRYLGALSSSIIASGICLLVGLILLGLSFSHGVTAPEDIDNSLQSPMVKERIRALQAIEKRNATIDGYQNYTGLFESPHASERYWLVRALASSRSSETYRALISFLDDPNPIVQYIAYSVLGRRGRTDAAGEIVKRIPRSRHWYSQLYAYRALRALGWTQRSPLEP